MSTRSSKGKAAASKPQPTPTPENSALQSAPEQASSSSARPANVSIWNRAVAFLNPTMTLRNTGSVARDHLANERTWLAWVRTSLSISSTGVALVQLFALSSQQKSSTSSLGLQDQIARVARPLGAVTIAFGLLVLFIGSSRYFRIQSALTRDEFPPARLAPTVMSGIMAALVVAVFAVVVTLTGS